MDSAASLTSAANRPADRVDVPLHVGVTQRFASGFRIAAALDVVLPAGSILVLFGPSGAGKTTMLRQIAGLERPDTGTIRFDNQVWCDVARRLWRPPQERGVGLVFQEPALFPHLTVAENVRYGIQGGVRPWSLTHASDAIGVVDIAALLGIADLDTRYPRHLSGGEAQRVALARALATGPRLLVLDEPFAALDAPARGRLRRDVRALLRRSGTPAVLVTHDRTEALAMGDSMAVAIHGQIRQVGGVGDVFSHPVDADVAASLGVEAVLPARVVESSDGLLTVAVNAALLHVAERAAGDPVAAGAQVYACIRAEDVTLEVQSPAHASARNHLAARVVSIAPEGPIVRVTLDCGFQLDASITRRSREELNLARGSAITAVIKATSIHLVPRM